MRQSGTVCGRACCCSRSAHRTWGAPPVRTAARPGLAPQDHAGPEFRLDRPAGRRLVEPAVVQFVRPAQRRADLLPLPPVQPVRPQRRVHRRFSFSLSSRHSCICPGQWPEYRQTSRKLPVRFAVGSLPSVAPFPVACLDSFGRRGARLLAQAFAKKSPSAVDFVPPRSTNQ
jgi:hypothetical protein